MTEPMVSEIASEQINLAGAWRGLGRYKWLLLATTILGAAIGVVATAMMQPVWEANALIRIGRVGQVDGVEPVLRVVARLENTPFLQQIKKMPGTPENGHFLYAGGFKVKPLPSTDLIQVRLRAYSRESAVHLIAGVANQLKIEHDAMMQPSIDRMKSQLMGTEKNMLEARNVIKETQQLITSGKANAAELALFRLAVLQQKIADVREMEQMKFMLEEKMHFAHTYPTSLVGDVTVSDEPVSPRKEALILLGALAGFLAGGGIAYARDRKKPRV